MWAGVGSRSIGVVFCPSASCLGLKKTEENETKV